VNQWSWNITQNIKTNTTHHSNRNITSSRCPPLRCSLSASRSWTQLMALSNTLTGILEISSCILSFSSWVMRGDGAEYTTPLKWPPTGKNLTPVSRWSCWPFDVTISGNEMSRKKWEQKVHCKFLQCDLKIARFAGGSCISSYREWQMNRT